MQNFAFIKWLSIAATAALVIAAAIAISSILAVGPATISGYSALTKPPDVSPNRMLGWWLFAVAAAAALSIFACAAIYFRRRTSVTLLKAAVDVLLPLLFLLSAGAVGEFVASTRSRTIFECMIASPALIWTPAFAAGIATLVFILKLRRSSAKPGTV